jgi:hypothetical protein
MKREEEGRGEGEGKMRKRRRTSISWYILPQSRGQIPQESGLNIHRPMKTPNLIYTRVVQDRYTCGITILFAIIGPFCL